MSPWRWMPDTHFNADATSLLVRRFSDSEVGAVAGNWPLAPVADLLLAWQLMDAYLAHLQHPNDYAFANRAILLA